MMIPSCTNPARAKRNSFLRNGVLTCLLASTFSSALANSNLTLDFKTVVIDDITTIAKDDFNRPMIIFSPKDEHVAFAIKVGTSFVVKRDQIKGKLYSKIDLDSLRYSPNGKRLTYVGLRSGKSMAVVDGIEGPPFDSIIDGPTFSPDSIHVGYWAKSGENLIAVMDGKSFVAGTNVKFTKYYNYKPFSPDFKHFAYAGENNGKTYICLDGVRTESDNYRGRLNFDWENRLIYLGEKSGKNFVVTGGNMGPLFDNIGGFLISHSAKQLIYVGNRNYEVGHFKQHVVVNNTIGKGYDMVQGPVISPDGKHYAYLGQQEMGPKVNNVAFFVLDGMELAQYSWFDGYKFSQNSEHIAYIAHRGGNSFVVNSGVSEGIQYFNISDLQFSPNGSRLSYWVRKSPNSKLYRITDGKEGVSLESGGEQVFSPDSKHNIYFGMRGASAVIVADEQVTQLPAGITKYGSVVFESSGTFSFLATRGKAIIRVNGSIK